ncbi:MAG TPA: glycosyltransferase family 4 protein [Solirubrobacterales bacterium]
MARITMLLENNPYPQDVRVRSEATSLAAAGHRVTVIAPRAQGQGRRETIAGVEVVRFALPESPPTVAGYVLEYAIANARLYLAGAAALVRNADVVHLHNPPDTFFGVGLLARACGRKVVFDHHDLAPELFEEKLGNRSVARVLRAFERWTFRVATVVLAANESHREVAIARGGVDPAAVVIVRNGPPEAAVAAATTGRSGELSRPQLVFLGGMEEQDGVDQLVPVLQALRDRHDLAADLTLVGDGSRRPAIEAQAAASGLGDSVRFTGRVGHDEVPRLLAAADICLDPAPCTPLNERSTMVKIAEYMAARRPLVAYPLLETRRTAGDTALYAKCADVKSFAAAVAQLARDPELRACLAAHGHARVADLTWEASEQHLLTAYGAMLSGSGPRSSHRRSESAR